MTQRKIEQRDLTRGLLTDGLGTLIGGIFNTFPYTSFSQNVGLVGVTGVRSRWVTAVGGVILLILGLIPKLGALVTAVPLFVLGGAGIVMFGMVAATESEFSPPSITRPTATTYSSSQSPSASA